MQQALKGDRIHIKESEMTRMMEAVLNVVGEAETLDTRYGKIARTGMYPKKCWTCGRSNCIRKDNCVWKGKCKNCGDYHDESVCIYVAKCCIGCGERGHAQSRCPVQ